MWGFPFKDATPRVNVRSSYDLGNREIDLHVSELRDTEGQAVFGLMFRVHVRRRWHEGGDPSDFFEGVLQGWRSDVADFRELSGEFYVQHHQKEG